MVTATLQISHGIWAALGLWQGLWAWESAAVDWRFRGTPE